MEVIACPSCKGRLLYDQQEQVLVCLAEKITFPILHGAPSFFNCDSKALKCKEY